MHNVRKKNLSSFSYTLRTFLLLQHDSDPSFKRRGIQNGESLSTPPSPRSVEKISKCLSSPFIFAIFFFFILLTKKSISHRWNFSAFPYKRSPMKIYMRSFRRWFIPKIRSIKWKILFILFLSLLSAAHFLNFSRNLGSFPLLFLLLFFFFNSIDQPLIYNNLLVSWDRLKA